MTTRIFPSRNSNVDERQTLFFPWHKAHESRSVCLPFGRIVVCIPQSISPRKTNSEIIFSCGTSRRRASEEHLLLRLTSSIEITWKKWVNYLCGLRVHIKRGSTVLTIFASISESLLSLPSIRLHDRTKSTQMETNSAYIRRSLEAWNEFNERLFSVLSSLSERYFPSRGMRQSDELDRV